MPRTFLVPAALLVFVSCAERPTEPEVFDLPVFSRGAPAAAQARAANFGAPMSSAEEVTTDELVATSRARGNALFQLDRAGRLTYQLSVANIENVTMAHIHLAPFGQNGPVIVWLYPSTSPGADDPGGGRIQGVIAKGEITQGDLVGLLAGMPLSALLDAMRDGQTYVNVHTDDGVAPPNTGPGDFPPGEIRGQIRHRGH